jgi:hypothetical protein
MGIDGDAEKGWLRDSESQRGATMSVGVLSVSLILFFSPPEKMCHFWLIDVIHFPFI